ncbi:transposase, Mutator family protein [Mycobacterium xenopi 4042]|uniref:Transposase, Mutator family protein n=1 Tax=Mycobacterium xenopi 4042 TaxID=1299334 RepID=X8BBI8_MYCXE|nr:transposase, Mutator family protein [Mycobacterium xenopi 4042]
MDKLVKTLGIDSLSKSQVSRMATDLDEHVEAFRHRPLDSAGPFTFVAADALTMKVREGGRVVNGSCCWPLASTVTDTAKSWACGWSPARPARLERVLRRPRRPGLAAYAWSPATPRGLREAIAANLPERPGSGVAHTTRPT